MAPGSGVLKDGYCSCARNEGGLGSVVCAVDAGRGGLSRRVYDAAW